MADQIWNGRMLLVVQVALLPLPHLTRIRGVTRFHVNFNLVTVHLNAQARVVSDEALVSDLPPLIATLAVASVSEYFVRHSLVILAARVIKTVLIASYLPMFAHHPILFKTLKNTFKQFVSIEIKIINI